MKESSLSEWPNEITTEGQKMNLEGNILIKKKSHHELIFTITDAEILEPIQNKSENDKTLEDLMFSDHELVQKSSENKRTAVSLNNRGLSIV